ncbi:MAG: 5-(carboxyamino)imidazole ribonucleotide synthase [Comamonadaceae bacterium]|nr:MAG: 5-(carboxyamino)imidazole ribonucleotide synthase [Comamonadaceae bacterium]
MSQGAILPGATLGVMGGGQLGRMFAHAAQQMGYFTAVLDPDASSPAGLVSHHHVKAGYLDDAGLAQLAALSAAITTEFENVPALALETLAATRPVAPAGAAVAIAQDRLKEKAHFTRCGVPCAPYGVIETPEQLAAAGEHLLPGILKTSRMGYDGKGQVRVKTRAELDAAWHGLKGVSCVLEKMLPLAAECSVIVARGRDGAMVNFPPQVNLHRDGILAVTQVFEGNLAAATAKEVIDAAKSIADGLHYTGVLCVEFFLIGGADGTGKDATWVVNEMAPRPHNSGHYTMDACDVSQFDLQVRTLAGLPLVQPRQHSPAIMLNLLGDLWHGVNGVRAEASEAPVEPPWDQVLALPGAQLHMYGKVEARRGRKMGHLNVTGADIDSVRATALRAAQLLGIEAF